MGIEDFLDRYYNEEYIKLAKLICPFLMREMKPCQWCKIEDIPCAFSIEIARNIILNGYKQVSGGNKE